MPLAISGSFTQAQIEKLNIISNDKANAQRKKNQVLDKDAFLKLMTVQLQHQDPLSPMDNSQYMNQMAQFSSVEQLANMSESMTSSNKLNETISSQLGEMTKILKSMSTNKTDSSEETNKGQTEILKQNEKIINELIKLNSALENYMSTNGTSNSEDLLASLGY